MQPRIRVGLIFGFVGLVLNICVAGFLELCGPVVSLLAGGLAGLLAARQERPLTKSEAARAGATAGALTGGLIILGQIIGGMAALYYMQSAGGPTIFGQIPSVSSGAAAQIPYYLGGLGFALCFGIVGALLAAGAGAGAAYLATSDAPMPSSDSEIINP